MFEFVMLVVLANLIILGFLYVIRHFIAIRAPVLFMTVGVSVILCILYPFVVVLVPYPQVFYLYAVLILAGAAFLSAIENKFLAAGESRREESVIPALGDALAAGCAPAPEGDREAFQVFGEAKFKEMVAEQCPAGDPVQENREHTENVEEAGAAKALPVNQGAGPEIVQEEADAAEALPLDQGAVPEAVQEKPAFTAGAVYGDQARLFEPYPEEADAAEALPVDQGAGPEVVREKHYFTAGAVYGDQARLFEPYPEEADAAEALPVGQDAAFEAIQGELAFNIAAMCGEAAAIEGCPAEILTAGDGSGGPGAQLEDGLSAGGGDFICPANQGEGSPPGLAGEPAPPEPVFTEKDEELAGHDPETADAQPEDCYPARAGEPCPGEMAEVPGDSSCRRGKKTLAAV